MIQRHLPEAMHLWHPSDGLAFGTVPGTEIFSRSQLIALADNHNDLWLQKSIDNFNDSIATRSRLVQPPENDIGERTTLSLTPGKPSHPMIQI